MIGNLLSGAAPKWLKTFQKGAPGEPGIYLTDGRTRGAHRLYGPVTSPAYASVLAALTQNRPGAWPEASSLSSRSSVFGSRYDAAELHDLVTQPDGYGYASVKLLPVTKLKLAISETEALERLRIINMSASRWFHFFGFEEPPDDDALFPFAVT